MPSLGLPELVLILVIALIVFGPGKLPDVGRAVGKAVREFRVAKDSVLSEANDEPKKEVNPQEAGK
ncbi:twin-arginine translocase TatA/TatE family subunit [Thermanaerosceptrum fracticalcis]|uniref:Sec-independent protein translocase protein TatA n=1 Tax=Thermanaerosceptrum fracticalcis TaxID=1712410 RepID=A0A7G6E3X1_THEFR|nr:twin-arginine translocase TatA/TatE family subunit [Thermanaerosceptrum fracticalcis]QNB46775.1 twin-arginine translocase TatA/TatE family subunit [Thermanaerosceptrum fracticalcis]